MTLHKCIAMLIVFLKDIHYLNESKIFFIYFFNNYNNILCNDTINVENIQLDWVDLTDSTEMIDSVGDFLINSIVIIFFTIVFLGVQR